MQTPFFIDYGGRMTDNRSSCVIMQEMKKKANLNNSSLELRKYILNNGQKIAEEKFQDVVNQQKRKMT